MDDRQQMNKVYTCREVHLYIIEWLRTLDVRQQMVFNSFFSFNHCGDLRTCVVTKNLGALIVARETVLNALR